MEVSLESAIEAYDATFAKQCPLLRSKLDRLLLASRTSRESARVVRLAKNICERCVKDVMASAKEAKESRIWQVLKLHGCVYLFDGYQDRVLEAVFALCHGPLPLWLTRSAITDRVLTLLHTELELPYSAATRARRISKGKVNHVLQILFRSGAFQMCKNGQDSDANAIWRLRDDFLNLEQLRRVHDVTIVRLAQLDGLFLSPIHWSLALYRGVQKTTYFQSIIGQLAFGLPELVGLLRKQRCVVFPYQTVDLFWHLSNFCVARENPPTAAQVQCALSAVISALHAVLATRRELRCNVKYVSDSLYGQKKSLRRPKMTSGDNYDAAFRMRRQVSSLKGGIESAVVESQRLNVTWDPWNRNLEVFDPMRVPSNSHIICGKPRVFLASEEPRSTEKHYNHLYSMTGTKMQLLPRRPIRGRGSLDDVDDEVTTTGLNFWHVLP